MTGFQDVELVGEKVTLRPVRAEDAPAAYALLRDGAVTRTLLWDGPASLDELADAYRRRAGLWRTGDDYVFAIEMRDAPVFIGAIGVRSGEHPPQIILGYWLGEPYWSKGYATDAARLAIHFAFAHLDAVRLYAEVFVGNEGSRRVLEKNGFHLDGTLRWNRLKRGEWRDRWAFTLLRPEWEANKDVYRPSQERVTRL